jgi:hypothetical protein
MNVEELRRAVQDLRINPNFYSILETKAMEGLVLEKKGSNWEIFELDERGGVHNTQVFENEDAACFYFLCKLEDSKEMFGANYMIHE